MLLLSSGEDGPPPNPRIPPLKCLGRVPCLPSPLQEGLRGRAAEWDRCVSLPGELSPCRVNNGGCQDLCLLTPKGHVNCSCRGERVLQEDFTCKGGGEVEADSRQEGMGWGRRRGAPLLLAAALTLLAPLAALNSTCNVHDEFECGNGDCIDFSRTCDGVVHCKDKSDEKQSYCSKVPPPAALLVPRVRPAGLLAAGLLLASLRCSPPLFAPIAGSSRAARAAELP